MSYDNPWIAAAEARRGPAIGWIVVGVGLLIGVAAVPVGQMLGTWLATRIAMPQILMQIVFYLCVFTPLWLTAVVAGAIEGRSVWRTERLVLVGAPAGLAIGALGYGLALGLAALTGVVSPGAAQAGPAIGAAAIGVLIVAFQAGAEEIFFRGWLQPVLGARLGPWIGLIITAGLFAGLHVLGGVRGPIALVNLVLGGLLFGLLAMRTGGLWTAFFAHWAWNWTETYGLGLDPNPGVNAAGALMNLDLVGAALWSGGEDGMNGSLAATIVLTLLVVGAMASSRIGAEKAA